MKKKNITVAVDEEVYRRARLRAAELDTSVSATVRDFLVRFAGGETDYDRGKRLQAEVLATIRSFRGGDRMSRDEVHDRAKLRRAESRSRKRALR